MIYFARFFSLVGGVATLSGMLAIPFILLLEVRGLIPTGLPNLWLPVLSFTAFAAGLLWIGQRFGNDLFKVRGKDSIFALQATRQSRSSDWSSGTGSDFGGDGGCSD